MQRLGTVGQMIDALIQRHVNLDFIIAITAVSVFRFAMIVRCGGKIKIILAQVTQLATLMIDASEIIA